MKMLNRNSICFLNMRDPQAIVYTDAKGTVIRLTREDFASEDEFLTWKACSDEDYRLSEKAGRSYYDKCIPVIEAIDTPLPSAEDVLLAPMLEAEWAEYQTALLEEVRSKLTQTQYRRLWMFIVERLNEKQIAWKENTTQQAVSQSLVAIRKKLGGFMKK